MPLTVFTQRNFAADFLQEKYNFRGKLSICVFDPLFGGRGLEAAYDVHLRLIDKLAVDFLLVIIEPFSLGLRAEPLRANID